jgi:hypothetical protein
MAWAICNASRQNSALGGSRPNPGLAVARLASRAWGALKEHLFAPYRPERHYMRGPGPKWHEKYGLNRRVSRS